MAADNTGSGPGGSGGGGGGAPRGGGPGGGGSAFAGGIGAPPAPTPTAVESSPAAAADENREPEDRLTQMLESRWDPGKLSRFMRASQSSKGQRLDASHRSRFEKRLGVDLGDVRIFSGELAEEITRAHNAEALTVGDTGMILMRQSSAFAPGSAAGTALLAHELTHVAQAKPSIMRKQVDTDLAEEDESEEEAVQQESEVLAEELGMSGEKESSADKDNKEKERKEKIREKVMELWQQDDWAFHVRLGMTRDYGWHR
jgi:hypothetical protein